MSTTLVTALYNIGRDKLTGKNSRRSFSKYLDWFKHLLHINVPMVIFIPNELNSYISEHRLSQYPTTVINREFTDLSAYSYHDRIQSTINSMVKEPGPGGYIPPYFSDCPEFNTARYQTIIFSKFDFLKEVANINPYKTDYFIWLDAGTFYHEPPFDQSLPWPDPYKIKILEDKFLVSDYQFDVNDKSPLLNKRSYLRQNNNQICAFMLGGTKTAIDKIHERFWREVDNTLQMGVINNEQHILQLMVLEYSEDYYIWSRTRYQYPQYPVPLRDRMIPVELARGTSFREKYPVNRYIKAITLATREIHESQYRNWENTARYYGYNYEIIGRLDKWDGFKSKIKHFNDALQTITEPYTILTDCTDLFFTGSADEAYEKFVSTGKDIIVGGELQMWYPNGKYHKNTIKDFFFNLSNGAGQAYPNTGFLMGKTESLRRLMAININQKDDQAACFDTIYEGTVPIDIDYDTKIIGNIPGYKDFQSAVSYFEFDHQNIRYRNIHTNEYPIAFHFPGKNMYFMKEFFNTSQNDIISTQPTESESLWTFCLITIIFIIFLILIICVTNRLQDTTL